MSDDLTDPFRNPTARRRYWSVLVLVSAMLGGGLYLTTATRDDRAEEPAITAAPAPDAAPALSTAPAPGIRSAEAEAADTPEPPAVSEAPRFDLVRVAPDGAALVAGQASPGAVVTVYADAAPLAEVEADAQGNFVAIFDAVPAEAPQSLTLGAAAPGTEAEVVSEEVVLLLPEAPAMEPPAGAAMPAGTAAPDGSPEFAALPDLPPAAEGEPPADAPQAARQPAPAPAARVEAGTDRELAPRPRVAATAIVRADGVEVIAGAAVPPRQVSLASISYAEDGAVVLAGLGTAGSRLRAYVDDGFNREGVVADDGRWSLALGEVEIGVYRLRVDQIDGEGRVASRVETPFQRDLPRAPRPRPESAGAASSGQMQVTVQPGANLWTLARVHYGAGVLYTQIFLANQELIRDPHLIYPGQIFDLPEIDGEAP